MSDSKEKFKEDMGFLYIFLPGYLSYMKGNMIIFLFSMISLFFLILFYLFRFNIELGIVGVCHFYIGAITIYEIFNLRKFNNDSKVI